MMRIAVVLSLGALLSTAAPGFAQKAKAMQETTNKTELATFGGGCLWWVGAVCERLDGVKSVTSGYAGGKKENPTYKEVCSGASGHAEVVQVEYDPKKVSYEDLLD